MAVGFGYIRDDKPTQIDWGQITKDATEARKINVSVLRSSERTKKMKRKG